MVFREWIAWQSACPVQDEIVLYRECDSHAQAPAFAEALGDQGYVSSDIADQQDRGQREDPFSPTAHAEHFETTKIVPGNHDHANYLTQQTTSATIVSPGTLAQMCMKISLIFIPRITFPGLSPIPKETETGSSSTAYDVLFTGLCNEGSLKRGACIWRRNCPSLSHSLL